MKTTANLSQKTNQELQSIITLLKRERVKIMAERNVFEAKYNHVEMKYNQLLEQLKLARLKRFGQSTETSEQLALFDEAAVTLPQATLDSVAPESTVRTKRTRHRRLKLPDHLPVEEILHDVEEADKTCGCGHARHRIGEVISDQLKYIPATLMIVRHIRPKYACRACEDGITIAKMPLLLLPKSIATPELVAQTILAKYDDHIPLYRQEAQWTRLGIDLPRNSCCALDITHNNTSELEIDAVSGDMHSINRVNFALMYLFGYRFMPRFIRLSSKAKKLLVSFHDPKKFKDYLIKPNKIVNESLIRHEWDNVLRILASLAIKSTTQAIIVKKLSSYKHANPTLRALIEFDKIIMSLYILEYIDDVDIDETFIDH